MCLMHDILHDVKKTGEEKIFVDGMFFWILEM